MATLNSGSPVFLYGESTPSYLASRLACKYMSEVVPSVKLIVLLRDPVSRAYSEYQMKERRVSIQNDFINLMQHHWKNNYKCMMRHNYDLYQLKQCFATDITSHPHYSRFVQAQDKRKDLYKRKKKELGAIPDMWSLCYGSTAEEVTAAPEASPALHGATSEPGGQEIVRSRRKASRGATQDRTRGLFKRKVRRTSRKIYGRRNLLTSSYEDDHLTINRTRKSCFSPVARLLTLFPSHVSLQRATANTALTGASRHLPAGHR